MPTGETKVEKELKKGSDLSIIHLVESLIEHAYSLRGSDIHIVPLEKELRVRFRIDGALCDAPYVLPRGIHSEIISRIKILCGLPTDEHQIAQDGRFRVVLHEKEPIDIRVSLMPTYYGENAVLRLLAQHGQEFNLDNLGFSKKNQEKVLKAIKKSYGMILATGPTGSGKTTTLYTLIKLLNTNDVSIFTIEDPIEYAIPGVEQVQANPRAGLTFANGLRSFLRQDPNIIMVGEIRDAETAGLAVNSSLTGHLLLSTLHTNDAATAIPRLLDMKIESYLAASTFNISIGQRLVRKLCAHCKTEKKITESERKSLGELVPEELFSDIKMLYRAKGCDKCNSMGFHGRIGIQEVLVLDSDIREAILQKRPAAEIKQIAIKNGMTTMIEDGLQKVKQGITTFEEILKVVHE